MKLFIAIWRQRGGCDYTIGCGIAVHTFQAENLDDAIKIVVRDLSSADLADDTADSIEQVDVVECVGDLLTVLPDAWAAERAARIALEKSQRAEAAERSEYERLRKKFDR